MTPLLALLNKTGLLEADLDYHLVRASMVIIYFFFGYQKWFDYEAQGLIPFFTHGPLIFWMYPSSAFKVRRISRCFGMVVWRVYCLPGSGIRSWVFWALLDQSRRLLRRERLFVSCRMARLPLQADFRR
jgi:Protein of unknown function, DUF417